MDVRFELPDPSFEEYTWVYDNEHRPGALPPLARAMAAMDSTSESGVPGTLNIGGYSFSRQGASFGDFPRLDDGLSALGRWREKWLPQVEACVKAMQEFDPTTVPAGGWTEWIAADNLEFGRIFRGVHLETVFPAMMAAGKFIDTFTEEFGSGREADAHALMHGFSNATLRRGQAVWDLSRLAQKDDSLLQALRHRSREDWAVQYPEFAAALDAFLDEHGDTVDGGLVDLPSWKEDAAPVVKMVLGYASMPDGQSPERTLRRAADRRQDLEAEVESKGSDALKRRLKRAQERTIVGEDHNVLNDQVMTAAQRSQFLKVGEALVRIGGAASPDDVFFYEQPELGAALDGGVTLTAAEIAARRETLQAYRAAKPPRYLGNAPDDGPAVAAGGAMHGLAASAGTARGRARLARTIEDADKLEPGEILVAQVTLPNWTPLFGIAGAVVTEAGGMLSHTAVVAREFGIPAVVGVDGVWRASLTAPRWKSTAIRGREGRRGLEEVRDERAGALAWGDLIGARRSRHHHRFERCEPLIPS